MKLKKALYNGLKYSSVPAFVATKVFEEITDAAEEKKKDNEVKRSREEAITERIRTSKKVDIYESNNMEAEVGASVQGETVNGKVSGKGGQSKHYKFED